MRSCFLLVSLFVDESQQLFAINTVYHASFFYGFAAGSGATQAVHADGKENGRGLGSQIQNIANNGFFGNFNHDKFLRFDRCI